MMAEFTLHPGLVLIAAGLALPCLRGAARSAAVVVLPLAVLWLVWRLPEGRLWQAHFMEHVITPLQVDRLSRLFALAFALMAAAGGLFALAQKSRVEVPAAFVYAGAAIGVALAGDLLSLFVFWELMAVGSTLVLWSAGDVRAYRATRRYLMIHLFGGVLLFAGIAGHVAQTGEVAFTQLTLDSPSRALILAGFLVNAGAPPLSGWIPDAYPEASWSGTVFLSAFTTKSAVYVLIRGFAGTEMLVWLGLFMAFYGIVYGLLENDMRRLLAYAIVNQSGFMLVGVGIGTELALDGAAAQAFTGVIYMGLLLMAAGVVVRATGRRRLSEVGGLARAMPLTALCGTVGALSIAAFPLTSGFVAKAMVSQAAADAHRLPVWLLLTAASAGVVLHAGLRFPWSVFFGRATAPRPADVPWSQRFAMPALAALCIAFGAWPEPLYALLPHTTGYRPYTWAHVVTQLQLLLFAALGFAALTPLLKRAPSITLDVDWLWRRALPAVAAKVDRAFHDAAATVARGTELLGRVPRQWFGGPGCQRAPSAAAQPTRSMALWVLVLLLGYLLLYYG